MMEASRWGGATAIAAWSLMTTKRVIVHRRDLALGTVVVEELSHGSVYGNEAHPIIHVLHNGVDHYDAMVEIHDIDGRERAWEQPPPPRYVAEDPFPPLSKETQQPSRRSFTAPRPTKKPKTKKPEKKAKKEAEADMEVQEESLMEELERIPVAIASDHPHRSAEELIKDRDGR